MLKNFLNESQTTLKKSRKRLFDPKNGRKLALKTAKMSKFLYQNFYFGDHLSTFWAKNTQKSRPLNAQIIACSLPKQLWKKLWESPEIDFFDTQNGQKTDVNMTKSVDFWVNLRFLSTKIALLAPQKIKKCFPS